MKKRLYMLLMIAITFAILQSVSVSNAAETPDFTGYTAISTKEDLNAIQNDLSGKYYLTNDIVFTSEDFISGYQEADVSHFGHYKEPIYDYWFKPIGDRDKFTGVFDGNGFKICNLQIYGGNCTALFSYNAGKIHNLGLVNIEFIGYGYDVAETV